MIGIRGGFTPLIDVALSSSASATTRSDPLAGVTLLIETEGGVRSALMVDAIQDQRQVVIKSLEANYGHVEGIAAATILGDGRIALILDADAIVARLQPQFAPSESCLQRDNSHGRDRNQGEHRRARIHHLPHRLAVFLRRHHVGARDPRLDAGDRSCRARRASCAA